MNTNFMVVDNDGALVSAFTRALAEDMPDAILVNVDTELTSEKETRCELDEAIELIELGRPLILYSVSDLSLFNLSQRFHWLYGHRNCGFVKMPARLDAIKKEYESIKYANLDQGGVHDDLCLSLLNIEMDVESVEGMLRHDLPYVEKKLMKLSLWIERAKKIGYTGTDQEIMAKLRKSTASCNDLYRPFAGRYFRGSFVDLEGTLFIKEELNPQVLAWIKERASKNSPILWTGGNLKEMAFLCQCHRLPWKVLPKRVFQGATVQEAIDDRDATFLKEEYGITVENLSCV